MIVARAPLRISFVGGGTDLPDFYRRRAGQVVSTTIDKFVYVVLNRTPMVSKVSARYSISETVGHPSELRHTRIRAALLDLGIEHGIEVGSFGALPARTGLGSSSSFSVALIKALHAYEGRGLTHAQAAEFACRLEIERVGEPIGKQDQYAAAYGGFNVIQFHENDTVTVSPVLLGYEKRLELQDHLYVVFTGITRPAGQILQRQLPVARPIHQRGGLPADLCQCLTTAIRHVVSNGGCGSRFRGSPAGRPAPRSGSAVARELGVEEAARIDDLHSRARRAV